MPSFCTLRFSPSTPQVQLRPPKAVETAASKLAEVPRLGDADTLPPVPGGGMTRAYLEAGPPTMLALLQFCAEGDNRGDAYALAESAARLCRIPRPALREPESWKTLFGGAPEPSLYG